MKETFFFSHDFGARNDPKLQEVLMDMGCEGLGLFWCIVEMMYEQGGTLPLSSCKSIAFSLHVDLSKIDKIINEFDLFETDGEMFWSQSIKERLMKRTAITERRKQAAKNRWDKNANAPKINANAPKNDANAPEIDANAMQNKNIDSPIEAKKDTCPYSEIAEMWNEVCTRLPKVVKLNEARKHKIRCKFAEFGKTLPDAMATYKTIISKVAESRFLCGDNKQNWNATFDWVFDGSKNWIKIIEGNYDNKRLNKELNVNDLWETTAK